MLDAIKPADLRLTRERLGMTQGEFAKLLGCRRETVTLYESGRAKMPGHMAFTLLGIVQTFGNATQG